MRLMMIMCAAVVASAGCGDDTEGDGTTGSPSGTTTAQGGTGGTGGTGGGTGADGGMATGGMGGAGGEGGSGCPPGECYNCNEILSFAPCALPDQVCMDSVMFFDDVFGCMCGACATDCDLTCNMGEVPSMACLNCLQMPAGCKTEYDACIADTN